MNVLLIGMPAHWEDRLREVLSERGHTYRIINDVGEIATAREQANQPLVFLGVGETIDKANDVCRQLRADSRLKPLQILACGAFHSLEKVQALLQAGANDYLTDLDMATQLELRLLAAEFRAAAHQIRLI